uniref:Putative ovule protein n=1 Tax=Solanum chacoense TaxID=4108 RepID=A0A0V0GY94_SOLCH
MQPKGHMKRKRSEAKFARDYLTVPKLNKNETRMHTLASPHDQILQITVVQSVHQMHRNMTIKWFEQITN